MSHCAQEATLEPKRFEFTLKTVITDVFVAQVYWEAVPKMVVRQQNSGAVEDFILPFSAVYLRIRK